MVLHGDGSPTRRYLYAGDAADAFDTILHRGQVGQVYNVGSSDEVSNREMCSRILGEFGVAPDRSRGDLGGWVKYSNDRPFNDQRYAVDDTKMRQLGWKQVTSFEEGLRTTVSWYRRFGERWWGDIGKVVHNAFPIVQNKEVQSDGEPVFDVPLQRRKSDEEGTVAPAAATAATNVTATNGHSSAARLQTRSKPLAV